MLVVGHLKLGPYFLSKSELRQAHAAWLHSHTNDGIPYLKQVSVCSASLAQTPKLFPAVIVNSGMPALNLLGSTI